jgi:hypothetical protein
MGKRIRLVRVDIGGEVDSTRSFRVQRRGKGWASNRRSCHVASSTPSRPDKFLSALPPCEGCSPAIWAGSRLVPCCDHPMACIAQGLSHTYLHSRKVSPPLERVDQLAGNNRPGCHMMTHTLLKLGWGDLCTASRFHSYLLTNVHNVFYLFSNPRIVKSLPPCLLASPHDLFCYPIS